MDKLNTEILELYKFIDENYKNQSEKIFYYLELILDCIKNTKSELRKDISKNLADFSKVENLSGYARRIESFESIIGNYLDSFSLVNSNNIQESLFDDKQAINSNNIKFEDDFVLSHLLNEPFTNKKISAFIFEGIKYEVNDWKSALLKLCEILVNKDSDKFLSFVNSDLFSGKKRKYFVFNCREEHYRKIASTNIYVYTCFNTNTICEFMIKLLQEYNIPMDNVYVYLREENAFQKNENSKYSDKNHTEDVKIGKYVRESMRNLSNKHYRFSQDMLDKLTDGDATKNLFGIGIPFLKEVKPRIDISIQTKDVKGYNRYWKEIFRFNHKNYLIVSQWTEGNSGRFKMWLKDLHI